ncbi:hypothetical protein DFO54_102367 [Erwinia sp. AG740]|nr:hypothetical protein DFO54_102367 [Erwinia sp. AG740]
MNAVGVVWWSNRPVTVHSQGYQEYTQVNVAAEVALFERVRHRFAHVDITRLPDVGHTLGIHGLLGPMSESCADLLVQAAHNIVTS